MLARVYVYFFVVSVAYTKQVSRAPLHVQVCTLYWCFDITVHINEHTLRRVCTCARECAFCSLALGEEDGGFSKSMQGTCCWRGALFLI